ncbi:MAG: 4Fe-4S binding protein [Spirochaetes bacterium]|nr:4Fe-4S binding protein [Spirochaetota bacterium]MBU1080009.1 4Fe-4S binding protein [Spirochaetota bacterium]
MITKRVLFSFPKDMVEKPIVYHLVKDYDLVVNIFRARITPEDEGFLLVDVTGPEDRIAEGLAFVRAANVAVNESEIGLRWDEGLCTSCGNCLTHCPTGALKIVDRAAMKVGFEPPLCVECLSCISVCPFGACSSLF